MGGWGELPWGFGPWGGLGSLDAVVPLPGIIPGIIGFPEELPPLEHKIIGPTGKIDYPMVVSGFRASEVSGFASLDGVIERERAADQPDVYTDGAQWLVIDSETDEIVAAGDLFDPGISGGVAVLRADGWGKRLERTVDRYLLQNRDYSQWSESSGDPFVLKDPSGSGDPDDVDSIIQVDAQGGRILFSVPQETVVATGDVNRAAFWAQGARVGHIAFDWKQRWDNGKWTLRVHTATGPDGQLTQRTNVPLVGLDGSVDLTLTADEDLVTIGLVRTGSPGTSDGYWVSIKNLRVNDIATSDLFTFADVTRDIAGRAGFVSDPPATSLNILPLDLIGESRAAALDWGALIEDMWYRTVGIEPAIPVLQIGRWDEDVWSLADPEFPFDPIPLPRYDEIDMPFQYPNSSAIGYLTVTATERLPVPRSYGRVQLDYPTTPDVAQALGERLLAALSQPRLAGQATFTRGVVNGQFRTAHQFHGGAIYLPGQDVTLRVKSVERSGAGVTVTFDDGVAAFDRIVGRRQQGLRFRGLIG